MFNNVVKELLKVDRNALRALNAVYGFDFMADFAAVRIHGNYTINSILKELNPLSYDEFNSKIVIITKKPASYRTDYIVVSVTSGKDIDIEFKPHKGGFSISKTKLDDIWRKSDFHDIRKDKNADTFIIAQHKEFLKPHNAPKYNRTERANYSGYTGGYNYKVHYISQLDVTQNGFKFTLRGDDTTPTIYDIIDKSGYFLIDKRSSLKQAARALKVEREAAKFKDFDTTNQVNELKKAIKAKKLYIIEALQNAETAEELKKVSKLMQSYHGFAHIVDRFETLEIKATKKEYPSIERFNYFYDDIKKDLDNLIIE
jgi:hypothetical protein